MTHHDHEFGISVLSSIELIREIVRKSCREGDYEAWWEAINRLYAAHGAPFGYAERAIDFWLLFNQATTSS
jgi:hypothetical protein